MDNDTSDVENTQPRAMLHLALVAKPTKTLKSDSDDKDEVTIRATLLHWRTVTALVNVNQSVVLCIAAFKPRISSLSATKLDETSLS